MERVSAGVAVADPDVTIVVRALHTADDYAACVRLQRETWGEEFADYVPASLLKVVQMVGGVTVGAFTADGRMVGFVFGLTGTRDGRPMHWSHMLAVERSYRDHGLGRWLKEYQRELLREQGIGTIYWTFDPLVARNAHLNLNRLGTKVREYVPDMYGETGSPLHTFGTDRFVVAWATEVAEPAVIGPKPAESWAQAPVVTTVSSTDAASRLGNGDRRPLVRIEIPADIEMLEVGALREWRRTTRSAFMRLLGYGYRVIGFYSEERKRCYYVLSHAAEGTTR